MKHWLVMFRPETYELVKTHGTIGVLMGHRSRFESVSPGDGLIIYVSRVRQLDAYGQVISKPFQSTEAIFGPKSERYTHRARIALEKTGFGRDAKELLYGLSVFGGPLRTTPTNVLLCSGGFLEITAEDHAWLVGCMEGRITPHWEGKAASKTLPPRDSI